MVPDEEELSQFSRAFNKGKPVKSSHNHFLVRYVHAPRSAPLPPRPRPPRTTTRTTAVRGGV